MFVLPLRSRLPAVVVAVGANVAGTEFAKCQRGRRWVRKPNSGPARMSTADVSSGHTERMRMESVGRVSLSELVEINACLRLVLKLD